MQMGAVIDSTGNYRYLLWREWNPQAPKISFVMLNPSTADAATNDPTIRRCIGFAQTWGFGSIEVVNLFAYRATRWLDLRNATDPIGTENDRYLINTAHQAHTLLLAWGNSGQWQNRHQAVIQLLGDRSPLYCLGTTHSGQPRHPLYQPGNLQPIVFRKGRKIDVDEDGDAKTQDHGDD
ncbi:MAG: DUF1643 domain-containing protein [Scytolyngbya sp. HA4215-MV1]|nr:DUF1643 domain-containing protein [Scytolyngbya sp. HA4215-MV1]